MISLISPAEHASAFSLTLLGPMEVCINGERLPPVRSRKMLWLLALLALRQGRQVEREWLAGTLWPETDQAFANLRPALSQLRTALGDQAVRLLSANRRTLGLSLEGAEVDVLTFDAAIASKQHTDLKRAVELYRGPLLEGCTEGWIIPERERRAQDCLRALQTLAVATSRVSDHATSANYWRRAVELDPLWDAARRGLMESLAADGDTNAALDVYRDFTGTLQSGDVRAVPDAETSSLYHRLRELPRRRAKVAVTTGRPSEADEGVGSRISGGLLHASTTLIGREGELLEVVAALRRSRLVTLAGPGGIGKTRLALAVAEEIARGHSEYPEGVCLISLETLLPDKGEEPRLVIQQLATALGVDTTAGRPLLQSVTEHLRSHRILLVLDNCEHVLESSAQVVTHLLRECPGVRLLTTSREALRISGETVWLVPALDVPSPEDLAEDSAALVAAITGYEGIRLFVERAGAAGRKQKAFTLTSTNARDVVQLCFRLEGVPLALELAAARTGAFTPAQILDQLNTHPLDALTSRQRDIAPRHRTLRATLEWSFSLLSPEAQSFLGDMGVFRGGWPLEAAQALCPDADAIEMLTVLHDGSLIHTMGGRFSLLETVREFAGEVLERSGHADVVRNRHAEYFANWLQAEWKRSPGTYSSIECEYPNLIAALAWAMESVKERTPEEDVLLTLCGYLAPVWQHTGRVEEGRAWVEKIAGRAITKTDGASAEAATPRQILALNIQIWLLSEVGDLAAAAECSLQIYEAYRRAGNVNRGNTALFNAGAYLLLSDMKRAREFLEQSLLLERATSSDDQGKAGSIAELAQVVYLLGDKEESAVLLEEALHLGRDGEESDPHSYGRTMRIAGRIARSQGNHALALQRFEAALIVGRRLGDVFMTTFTLCGLAALARESGDQEREAAIVNESVLAQPPFVLAQQLRRQRIEMLASRGDLPEAMALARETLALLRGRARSFRSYLYALLLVLADMESRIRERHPERVACLLGAADGVIQRLGQVVLEPEERKRIARLEAVLAEERTLAARTIGAAWNDEEALEFALQQK